jgi:hypothetical protein
MVTRTAFAIFCSVALVAAEVQSSAVRGAWAAVLIRQQPDSTGRKAAKRGKRFKPAAKPEARDTASMANPPGVPAIPPPRPKPAKPTRPDSGRKNSNPTPPQRELSTVLHDR